MPTEGVLTASPRAEAATLGEIRLHAKDGQLHGTAIQYERDDVMDNIGYWTSVSDFVTWTFTVPFPASFSVVVEQASLKGCGGEYAIVIGSERLVAKPVETGGWENFMRCQIGNVNIIRAGEHTLKGQAIRIQGDGLFNLRTITLLPRK